MLSEIQVAFIILVGILTYIVNFLGGGIVVRLFNSFIRFIIKTHKLTDNIKFQFGTAEFKASIILVLYMAVLTFFIAEIINIIA